MHLPLLQPSKFHVLIEALESKLEEIAVDYWKDISVSFV